MEGMWVQSWVVVLGLVLSCVAGGAQDPTPEVQTTYGPVVGTTHYTDDGQTYERYLGIPFARPPLGLLRFAAGDEPEPWGPEPLSATEWRAECTQLFSYDREGAPGGVVIDDEDCLYLNIYVPHGVQNLNSSVPIMVWFYGGAFILGGTRPYNLEDLALHGGVVVVSVAYRVGPLGFLSTGDDAAPGNYGLWDAVVALRWIQENAGNFGGDVDQVTLFGQSAGGAVVSYMLYAPEARGLFSRGIALSGSAAGWWSHTLLGATSATDLGRFSRCPTDDNSAMVECLRTKDANALDIAGWISPLTLGFYVPLWVPVIDGVLVPEDPRDNMAEGLAGDYDVIVGATYHDAASFVFANPFGNPDMGFNLATYKELLRSALKLALLWWENVDELVTEIYLQYPDMDNDDLTTRTQAATQMFTDWTWWSALTYEATAHSNTSPDRKTFVYEFSYRNSFLGWEPWVNGSHADDLYMLFGENYEKEHQLSNWTETDRQVSHNYMSYFTNFAHTGDPNQGPHEVPLSWPTFSEDEKRVMTFGPTVEIVEQSEERQDRYHFWNVVFPELAIPRTTGGNSSQDLRKFLKNLESQITELVLSQALHL